MSPCHRGRPATEHAHHRRLHGHRHGHRRHPSPARGVPDRQRLSGIRHRADPRPADRMDQAAASGRAHPRRDHHQLVAGAGDRRALVVRHMPRARWIRRRRHPLLRFHHHRHHQLAGYADQRSRARSGVDLRQARRSPPQRCARRLRQDARQPTGRPHHAAREPVAADGAGRRIRSGAEPRGQRQDPAVQGAGGAARSPARSDDAARQEHRRPRPAFRHEAAEHHHRGHPAQ